MGAIQFSGNHPVQQDLPVRLRFQFNKQAFVHKEALFPGNRQGRHIGQLDKAELEVRLLGRTNFRVSPRADCPEGGC